MQPKKRTSKSKRNMRRSHHAMKAKSYIICPACGNSKQPHRVCMKCGDYRGNTLISVD